MPDRIKKSSLFLSMHTVHHHSGLNREQKVQNQRSIENKTEQQNKYWNSIIVTNFHLFYKNNAFRMTLLLLCNLCLPSQSIKLVIFLNMQNSKSGHCIADSQTFSDSIDKKSAGNLNLYCFDAI
jgi:hypothetical protein